MTITEPPEQAGQAGQAGPAMQAGQAGQPRQPLLQVRNLKRYYPIRKGVIARTVGHVRAVDDVSFEVYPGETLGIVGESGCGKSTTGRAIVRLETPTAGSVIFEGTDIASLSKGRMRRLRTDLQMVFQDPYSSLNPQIRIGDLLAEPLIAHHRLDRSGAHAKAAEILRIVGLPTVYLNRYPHELSGGQRQRVGIARALMLEPKLIVCDEPVSALDVSIQAQVINLFMDLQERLGLTYLFIAHDLAVVRHISTRIAVMYLGRIVEIADRDDIYREPLHPYTEALMAAVPVADPEVEARRPRAVISGEVPSALRPPPGCSFHTRCPRAMAV
ncbi:MAG TPA: oligopeptide/dipeptide ABC transporter ATP-binding protein, partial [Kribbella sp.]